MSIQALRERRAAKAKEARELLDKNPNAWSSDLQASFDALTAEVVALDEQIDRTQRVMDMEAGQRVDDALREAGERRRQDGQVDESLTDRGLLNTWLRQGDRGLSDEQARRLHATMSTTTGSEGGYTVPTEIARSLVEALKAYGGMRDVAQVLVTSSGNPLSYPTSDGTTEEGEIIAENGSATDLDPNFGTVGLPVYKYSSKVVAVPIELLQDSNIDIEAFIRARLVQRLGRVTNKHFTLGTGTGQPNGIVTAASVGKVGATGSVTTFSYDDLVDLVESVDEAYLEGGDCRFMFAQAARKVLRKLKDTSGRPIWTPGYELGITAKVPDLLLGHQTKINNHMPVPAASAKSIVFGDLSKYAIRDALMVSLFRFTDSAYTKKGQVGFLGWMRSGGNLLDTGAVKTYQHSAT